MIKSACILLLFLAGCFSGTAQQSFIIETDSVIRSYRLVIPKGETTHRLPLVILLHDCDIDPDKLAVLPWSLLRRPVLIAIPVALTSWTCDTLKSQHDQRFLSTIMLQVQQNFRVDNARIFIVGMGISYCLAENYLHNHPGQVRAAIQWNYRKDLFRYMTITPDPAQQADSLTNDKP